MPNMHMIVVQSDREQCCRQCESPLLDQWTIDQEPDHNESIQQKIGAQPHCRMSFVGISSQLPLPRINRVHDSFIHSGSWGQLRPFDQQSEIRHENKQIHCSGYLLGSHLEIVSSTSLLLLLHYKVVQVFLSCITTICPATTKLPAFPSVQDAEI